MIIITVTSFNSFCTFLPYEEVEERQRIFVSEHCSKVTYPSIDSFPLPIHPCLWKFSDVPALLTSRLWKGDFFETSSRPGPLVGGGRDEESRKEEATELLVSSVWSMRQTNPSGLTSYKRLTTSGNAFISFSKCVWLLLINSVHLFLSYVLSVVWYFYLRTIVSTSYDIWRSP